MTEKWSESIATESTRLIQKRKKRRKDRACDYETKNARDSYSDDNFQATTTAFRSNILPKLKDTFRFKTKNTKDSKSTESSPPSKLEEREVQETSSSARDNVITFADISSSDRCSESNLYSSHSSCASCSCVISKKLDSASCQQVSQKNTDYTWFYSSESFSDPSRTYRHKTTDTDTQEKSSSRKHRKKYKKGYHHVPSTFFDSFSSDADLHGIATTVSPLASTQTTQACSSERKFSISKSKPHKGVLSKLPPCENPISRYLPSKSRKYSKSSESKSRRSKYTSCQYKRSPSPSVEYSPHRSSLSKKKKSMPKSERSKCNDSLSSESESSRSASSENNLYQLSSCRASVCFTDNYKSTNTSPYCSTSSINEEEKKSDKKGKKSKSEAKKSKSKTCGCYDELIKAEKSKDEQKKKKKSVKKKSTRTKNYLNGGYSCYTSTSDVSNISYDPHQHRVVAKPTSNLETLMLLVKCSLGTGILAMPQAFANSGFLTGIIFNIAIGIMITHCLRMLERRVPLLTYSESMVAALEMGPPSFRKYAKTSGLVVNIFLVALQLGICCVYFVFIAGNLKKVLESHYAISSNLNMIITLLPLILVSFIPDLKIMAPFATLANILIGISLAIILFFLFTEDRCSRANIDWWGSIYTFPLYFGAALFALTTTAVVITLENNMKTPKDFIKPLGVLDIGMTLIVTLNIVIGIVGYLFCRSDCSYSIALDLPQCIIVKVVLVMYSSAIVISYALQSYVPINVIWMDYIFPYLRKTKESDFKFFNYCLRVAFVIFTFLLAREFKRLGICVALLGICALGIIFPAFLELWVMKDKRKAAVIIKDVLIIIVGAIGMVIFFTAAFLEIINTVFP